MSGYFTVEVTAEDIERGWRGWPSYCPIERALRRQTRQDWHVVSSAAWIGDLENAHRHALPKRAGSFTYAFDTGKPVKPFTFRLPL